MSRSARALRTTLVASSFGYASQGLSLIAIPLFLSTVGAEGYGLMVTVMAFMGYLNFADAGLSWGSMILIAQANGRESRRDIAHIVRHSAVLAAGSGLVVALALGVILFAAAAGWRLPMFAHHPEADCLILIAGVQLALNLQFSVCYNLFQGLQEGYWTGLYQGLSRFVGLAGMMAAAWLTHNVAVMMMVQLICAVLSGAAAVFHAWRRHPWAFNRGSWTDRSQYQAQLRTGAKSFLLQIGRTLGGTAPTLGISSILGPAAVPFYTVPTTLLSLFFTPINSWNSSMQSAYGEAWTSGAKDWVRSAFRQSLERALFVAGLGIGLFFALGDTFIRLWTHNRLWLSPSMAISISAITVTTSLVMAGEYLLTGLNRHRNAAVAEIANGVLGLGMVVLFVRWLGLGAVGAGVVGAAAVTSIWVVRREIRRQLGGACFPGVVFALKLGLAVAAGLAAAVVARLGGGREPLPAIVHLLFAGTVGAAAYLTAAFTLKLVATGEAIALGQRFKQRFLTAPAKSV